jgi:hypothetical protein
MFLIDENTLRYFFSTIGQSMAALFAVGGIFAIYRFQFLESQYSSAVRSFREFYRRRIALVTIPEGTPAYSAGKIENDRLMAEFDANEANEWLDKDILSILLCENKKNPNDIGILDYCYYFINIIEARTTIAKQLKCPMVLIVINFLISILLLIVVDLLSRNLLVFLAFGLLILTTITICKLFFYIKLCFNLPKILEFNNRFILENDNLLANVRDSVIHKIKGIVKIYSDNEFERLKFEMEKFLK